MKVKIGFCKPKNHIFPIFAWLIMWLDKSEFSHTYFEFIKDRKVVVFEAGGLFAGYRKYEKFHSHYETIEAYEANFDPQIVEVFNTLEGARYGVVQVIGMGLARVLKIITRGKVNAPNPFRDGKKTIVCSEVVSYVLRAKRIYIKRADNLWPKNARDIIVRSKKFRKVV